MHAGNLYCLDHPTASFLALAWEYGLPRDAVVREEGVHSLAAEECLQHGRASSLPRARYRRGTQQGVRRRQDVHI